MKSLHPAEHALNEYESIRKQDEKVKDYIQKVNPACYRYNTYILQALTLAFPNKKTDFHSFSPVDHNRTPLNCQIFPGIISNTPEV
jgi:hypothetical protein